MSLEQAYGNDADKEVGGVWFQYKHGIELLLRRAGGLNTSYERMLQRKVAPHRRKLRQEEELPEELADRLLAEVYAETIVMDWRTKQADGQYVPTITFKGADHKFDKKVCVEVFKALPDFFNAVRVDAATRAQFTAEAKEADAGN